LAVVVEKSSIGKDKEQKQGAEAPEETGNISSGLLGNTSEPPVMVTVL
jgi:hypothetical protein